MLAHALRWALLQQGAGPQLGAFCATLLVGATIAPLARRFGLPLGVSTFASVVSGVFRFETASGLLDLVDLGTMAGPAVLLDVLANAATAVLILLAMTACLILPKMVSDGALHQKGSPEV